jgi:tyrosine decarboxylase/aspartate 1-decarboxylase
MQEQGINEKELLRKLEKILSIDSDYGSGKILSSMCSKPIEITKKAYDYSIEKNLGDRFLFPGSDEVEKETVAMLGNLLSNDKAVGNIVSGGTEANITALWAAKKISKHAKNEVILPESAHFSFDRAAEILGLKLIKIPLTPEFRMDIERVSENIHNNTLALIGIAGSTSLGAVDPLSELSDIAMDSNLYFHVDAAFGGFVLPFLKDLGYFKETFDFELSGVKSITIDPHKMGLCPIASGGILFRDLSSASGIVKEVDYIGNRGISFSTLMCTRPASRAVAVWLALKSLGRTGYRRIVKNCYVNTMNLFKDLSELKGIRPIVKPTMNILGFTCSSKRNESIFRKLTEKGWYLSLFKTHIRVIIMPHTDREQLKQFVSDLKKVLTEP